MADSGPDSPLHLAAENNSKEFDVKLLSRETNVKDGGTPLHWATKHNNKKTAAKLLQSGADINAVNEHGHTPLHLATEENNKKIAAELLQRGADVNVGTKRGNTSLHWAARKNRKKIATELLQHGADVNVVNNDGNTSLHWAARNNRKKIVAGLLQHGADVNAVNKDGNTPLHWASSNNSKEVAAELLQQKDVNVNAMNKRGYTPLYWAVRKNRKMIAAELLHHGADVNVVNKDGNTPLHWASWNNSKEIATKLLQRGADVNVVNKDGNTPLHWAASNNSKKVAAELLQRGADVNAVNKDSDTPLHRATEENNEKIAAKMLQSGADVNAMNKRGDTPLHRATEENNEKIAAKMLQSGADVNAMNKRGDTPLHRATEENNEKIAAKLLQSRADVNAVNKDGDTPLHWAARHNSKEVVADLLQREADVNAMNKDGNTALHWAARNKKEIAVKLLQCGSNFTISNLEGYTPLDIAFQQIDRSIFSIICEEILSNAYSANDFGRTAFHISAKLCIREVLDLSERTGHCREAILYNKDSNGNSPLHYWAMASSHDERVSEITEYGKTLIKMGLFVNSKNNQDQTPLHVACSWEAAVVLLENGAWPNVTTTCSGDTPLLTRVKSLGSSSHRVYEGVGAQRNTTPNHNTVDISSALSIQEWQEIIERGMDPWITNLKGESVLGLLVNNENFVLVHALVSFLKDAAPADKKHTNSDTILHIICSSGADEIQQVIDDLLKSGVNVNAMNSAKETALLLVCRRLSGISDNAEDITNSMYYWTASRLLAYGADPTLQDTHGASCYEIAEGVPYLVDLLKQPIDMSVIPPLLRWSEPKSEAFKSKIAQVVRNQRSSLIECYYYHNEPIGSGAFGHVFAGVDERNGREVAVKRLDKHRLVRPEDRREIANLVKLRNCEEVVRYLGHCEDTHFVFVILDLMEGTLNEYLDKSLRDATLDVTLCRDVVKGLQFLHQNNVLHRDIKPGNILYKISPRVCLKLADFGLSTKAVCSSMLQTVSVMHAAAGTRCWMAPELLLATEQIKHSEASDVFACGLVLHFLLAMKRHPFTQSSNTPRSVFAEQNETEQNIMYYKPFMHKDLSPEARDLLEKMLDQSNSKRLKITDVLSHPFFWSKMKSIRFLEAVANQPEVERPRHKATPPSPVELQLEKTLGNDFAVIGWENSIPTLYIEMTGSGGRRYDTTSAVDLVRFVRNSYAHTSHQARTAHFQDLLMKDFVFFDKFPALLVEVYKAVKSHGWDKARTEIESTLKMD